MRRTFFYIGAIAFLATFFAPSADAQTWSGTYVVNGYTVKVTATHQNNDGDYEGGSYMDTKKLAQNYYNKALASTNLNYSYSNVSDCGNTTGFKVKILSCPVVATCSGSYRATQNANCTITRGSLCEFGCTSGACNAQLSASCSGGAVTMNATEARTYEQKVKWVANASGGSGSYTYKWTSTDTRPDTAINSTSKTVTKLYKTTGTKDVSLKVTSDGFSRTVSCSSDGSTEEEENDEDVPCTQDIYDCGAWGACTNGSQSRSCVMTYDCPAATTPSPSTSQSCTIVDDETADCAYPAADGSCPAPTIQFSANPRIISAGGTCTLRWNVQGAETCTIDGVSVNPAQGSQGERPEEPTVYKLTCMNGPSMSQAVALCGIQDVTEE